MSDSYKSIWGDETKYLETQTNLKERISDIQNKILELEDQKISLMMLKRDIMFKHTKQTLENCFTDEMKQMLEDRFSEEKS
tara:strand:+ start:1049 stop:1291 length:243 start_codon:yes stop_codon:yes gene_type:complete